MTKEYSRKKTKMMQFLVTRINVSKNARNLNKNLTWHSWDDATDSSYVVPLSKNQICDNPIIEKNNEIDNEISPKVFPGNSKLSFDTNDARIYDDIAVWIEPN